VCGQVYLPKAGKVVTVGAQFGEIFQFDPSNPTKMEVKHLTPFVVRPSGLRLSSVHAGKTAAQLIAEGSITLIGTGELPTGASAGSITWGRTSSNRVFIPTSDRKWAMLVGTSGSIPAFVSAGASFTLSGLRATSDSSVLGLGDTDTVIPTNSVALADPPAQWVAEAGVAILPSGDLCYLTSTSALSVKTGMYRWDGVNSPVRFNLPSDEINDASVISSSFCALTVLPSGQLLLASRNNPFGVCDVYIWTDTVSPDPAAKPIIDYVDNPVRQGNNHTVTGKQLSGIHVGGQYGDEQPWVNNHPLVRLTDKLTNKVYFCPTNWSYRGIKPMRQSTCEFVVPITVPTGEYFLNVISAGNVSDPVTVTVKSTLPTNTVTYDHYNNR
jgi:hypothetical protein